MTNRQFTLIRLYQGLTQQEFADKYGISKGAVAKMEVNIINVSQATKAKVLKYFNMLDSDFIQFCKLMNETSEA